MDERATLIAAAANVAAARAAAPSIPFDCPLSPKGAAPATHYASSGVVPSAEVVAAQPHCTRVVTGEHDAMGVLVGDGLVVIAE